MQLLHDDDRRYILDQLRLAPDSVLADAMLAFNEIRDKLVIVRKMVERPGEPANEAPPKEAPSRPNVSPGKSSITKIGSDTKTSILAGLANNGVQPPTKYTEHLKLLWSRGEVKFDGKEYYL